MLPLHANKLQKNKNTPTMSFKKKNKTKIKFIETPRLYDEGKLYASSAFFTPGLHPTVEDQVELARRISKSLSDTTNNLSKGQTMYVNRKKRSVKWVHEGEGIFVTFFSYFFVSFSRFFIFLYLKAQAYWMLSNDTK